MAYPCHVKSSTFRRTVLVTVCHSRKFIRAGLLIRTVLKGSSTPTAVHCNKPDTATNLWVPTATADFQGANSDTRQNKQSSRSKQGAAAAVLLLSAAAGLFYGLETRGMVAPNLLAASSVSAKLLDIASILWSAYCSILDEHPLFTKAITGLVGCALGDLLAQWVTHRAAPKQALALGASPAPPAARDSLSTLQDNGSPISGDAVSITAVRGILSHGQRQPSPPTFRYDFGRGLRLLLFSALTCPIPHNWYLWLDSFVLPEAPTSLQAIAVKVALDQLFLAPVMLIIFFVAIRMIEEISSAMMSSRFQTNTMTEGGHGLVSLDLSPMIRNAMTSARLQFWPSLRANYILWPLAHVVNFALIPSSQRILYINLVSILWMAFLSSQATSAAGKESTGEGSDT